MRAAPKMGTSAPVNIPIQMYCAVDTTGRMSPIKFRVETSEHMICTIHIDQIISRDEKNYVGIREKQFFCSAQIEGVQRLMEIRYSVDTQKWRIFQFLS